MYTVAWKRKLMFLNSPFFPDLQKRRYIDTEIITVQYYIYEFILEVYKLPASFKYFRV